LTVGIFGNRLTKRLKLARIDPPEPKRDFFRTADLKALPLFGHADEFGGFEQSVGRAGAACRCLLRE
jgi:hypothetical protein